MHLLRTLPKEVSRSTATKVESGISDANRRSLVSERRVILTGIYSELALPRTGDLRTCRLKNLLVIRTCQARLSANKNVLFPYFNFFSNTSQKLCEMHQARSEHRRSLTARQQNPLFWLLFLSNTLHRYFNHVDLRSSGLLLACSFACKQIAWLDLRSAECNQSVRHTITCTTTSDTLCARVDRTAGSFRIRTLAKKNVACFFPNLRTLPGWLQIFTFLEARARCIANDESPSQHVTVGLAPINPVRIP